MIKDIWSSIDDIVFLQDTCRKLELSYAVISKDLKDEQEASTILRNTINNLHAKLNVANGELRSYQRWHDSINEAFNSGDGSYRP